MPSATRTCTRCGYTAPQDKGFYRKTKAGARDSLCKRCRRDTSALDYRRLTGGGWADALPVRAQIVYMLEHGHTQQSIAETIGRDPSTIRTILRMRRPQVQQATADAVREEFHVTAESVRRRAAA